MKKSSPEKFSQASKEAIRLKAIDQGRVRYERVVECVVDAMQTIESEIKGNDGVYPGNGGALNLSELMRRSNISLKALFGQKYRDGFKREIVDPWLEKIKKSSATSRAEVKKNAAKRILEWRELYEDLLQSHRKSELDLQEALRMLAEAERLVLEYRRENQNLIDALGEKASGKVVRLEEFIKR